MAEQAQEMVVDATPKKTAFMNKRSTHEDRIKKDEEELEQLKKQALGETEEAVKEVQNNGKIVLGPIAQFVRELSVNVPLLYGMFSIVLALGLGIGAAIVRRFLSKFKAKFIHTPPPASLK